MPLQVKYRPKTFAEIVGNFPVIGALRAKMKSEIPSSILITGPSGCGKTTLGRIIASYVGSYNHNVPVNINFHEYNFALNRGIDVVREILSSIYLGPINAKYRVFLFDEFHQITTDGATALLKPLEEAPEHVIFIMCTNEPEKLSVTIKRRLFQCGMSLLSDEEVVAHLHEIVKKEDKSVPKDVLESIAEASGGSLGVALRDLDGIISLPLSEMSSALSVKQGTQKTVIDLCRVLTSKSKVTWKQVLPILKDLQDEEPEKIRRAVMGYCNSILLKQDNPKVGIILDSFITCNTYNSGKPAITNTLYTLISYLND